MREYKVNERLSLKLENDVTIIYVNGVEFIQCKGVVLNRTPAELEHLSFDLSIDELVDQSVHEGTWDVVPPETEFLVHCSNLSAWAENDYNSELLHSNLAFPLLKKLVEEGDETAKRVFKEEIVKRLESGYLPVITYLSEEEYDDYLTREEWYNAILGHDLQGFREADALIDFEEMMGRKLDLVESMDTEVGYDFRIENRRVVGISIGGCELKSIPESIGNLINLKEIHILYRGIGRIPESIGNLENLEILDIPSNKIECLPSSIGNLKSLKVLNLNYNKLKEVDDTITVLNSLEDLNLEGNQLCIFHNSIGDLKNLKKMNLRSNLLNNLPENFKNLKKLELLDLSLNKFKEIPAPIYFLSSLKILNISKNEVKNLLPELKNITDLKEMYIGFNKLKRLPNSIQELKQLEILSLIENQLEEIPSGIICLNHLKMVDIRKNRGIMISPEIKKELNNKLLYD